MTGGISKIGGFDSSSISQLWQNMFSKIGGNSNGLITGSDLETVIGASQKSSTIEGILSNLDTNRDGAISKSESDTALAGMEQQTTMADFSLNLNLAGGSGRLNNSFVSTIEPSTEDIFSAIDTNGDGSIDKTELLSFLQDESSTDVDTAFSVLDTDGDGKISQSELDAAMKEMQNNMAGNVPPPPPPMISSGQNSEDLFNTIDTNGDGSIDKTELQTFLDVNNPNVDTVFSSINANEGESGVSTSSTTESNTNSIADLSASNFDERTLKNKLLMEILNSYTALSFNGSDDESSNSISLFV